jgi:hypothetical protein
MNEPQFGVLVAAIAYQLFPPVQVEKGWRTLPKVH